MPRYQGATWSGESVVLDNGALRVEFHRRSTGWGWAELYTPSGTLMGVLDHFGEVKFPGNHFPSKMEAENVTRTEEDGGQRLSFNLTQATLEHMTRRSKLHGPPYQRVDGLPVQPLFGGEAEFTLDPERPVLRYRMICRALEPATLSYIRGPWLLAGADSFGGAKEDAIFAGVEWCIGDEWSSGTDWFRDPWALRVAPHPLKVTAPFMAVSHGGHAIGLTWNPGIRNAHHWDRHYSQPVFASPDFINRKPQHVLGLMFPAALDVSQENTLESLPGVAFLKGMQAHFEGEIRLAEGDSLDLMTDWVREHGLPTPSTPRYALEDAIDRIARAYNTHLWFEGKGWGMDAETAKPYEPDFVARYIEEGKDRGIAEGLAEKRAWVCRQAEFRKPGRAGHGMLAHLEPEQLHAHGQTILGRQREDGSFPFEPEGYHAGEHHEPNYVYCEDTYKPLGMAGETALDLCVVPALELLELHRLTGEDRFAAGARAALDYCLPMRRPEGGDWWETPLKSPNLLAAGHGAIAYELAHRVFGTEDYRQAAVHWIRALLPFTRFWEASEHPMLYNTKPCFCSTNWWLADWVTWHVQWEVLQTFAISHRHGIEWGDVDGDIDWRRYREGVTIAALRWMLDHDDPGSTRIPLDEVATGKLDTLYHDIHDAVRGEYGGALILPEPIATNLYAILDARAEA